MHACNVAFAYSYFHVVKRSVCKTPVRTLTPGALTTQHQVHKTNYTWCGYIQLYVLTSSSTQVRNTDVGTGTHSTVSPALLTAGMEGGHTLSMAGMEGRHTLPTYDLLVTDTTSLLLPRRPMQTTWQPYSHLSENHNRMHTQTSNTHEMSEYTEDGEDLPSPVEEIMYYERGRGVVQYSVEETGQQKTQEMVSGRLPF